MYFYLISYMFYIITVMLMMLIYIYIINNNVIILEMNILYYFNIDFKLYFYMDKLSMMFMFIVSLISMSIFVFSKSYMATDKLKNYFITLTLMFVMSMYLTISSLNLWFILWGWDGLGVISYLLVIFYKNNYSNYSGLMTILTNRLGDVGLILSIYFILNMNYLDINLINNMHMMNNLFMMLISLSIFTKSAQFPFSAWLPLAMAAPTPISSLVHSSTLVTAGVYLLIRLNMLTNNNNKLNWIYTISCLMTAFLASWSALFELDLKKIIAFSTMSQLSLMFLILLMTKEILSFYHILTHASFKALLFMCSGIFIHEYLNNQDIRNYSFMLKYNPLISTIFFICNMSLMGLPFLSGFYSKDLILEYLYTLNLNLMYLMMIIVSTMMSSIYSLRMINYTILSSKKSFSMIIKNQWDLTNCSMFMIIFMVIFQGSLMNWLILEKLEFFYMKLYIKMTNMMLILNGIFLFLLFKKINFMKVKYSQSLFYLLFLQGIVYNKFMMKLMYYYKIQSEFMLYYMIEKKNMNLIIKINYIIFHHKLMYYLYMFFIFLILLMYTT